MLEKIEGRRRGHEMMGWLDGITDVMDMSLGKLGKWQSIGKPGTLQSMGFQRVRHDWATEQQYFFKYIFKDRSLWDPEFETLC